MRLPGQVELAVEGEGRVAVEEGGGRLERDEFGESGR